MFYNANLVEQRIDREGGAIGFVDDFNAGVVGDDEEHTTRLIQERIIPHATRWAAQSGATFETDKTSLIHFTKRAKTNDTLPIYFGGNAILPQGSVKVLGVTLDKKLAMDEHIANMTRKGTYACTALQAIKGTRPAQLRQLYRCCVLPIVDYAASTWYGPGKPGVKRLTDVIDKVQRLGARGILRAWKQVSLPVLEAEAYLESTQDRLNRKTVSHAVKLFALPEKHPAKKAALITRNTTRFLSPLVAVLEKYDGRIGCRGKTAIARYPAWTKPRGYHTAKE